MASWAICTPVKAPTDQVLAFVAHHLTLGPDRIHLFFDNPDDPAVAAVAGIAGVTAVRCDTAHWTVNGFDRPEKHQERQRRNLGRIYRAAETAWVLHIDVDEFLIAERPVASLLDRVPETEVTVKAAPFDALCDPSLPDDIFTASRFRGVITDDALRLAQFGPYAEALDHGILGHKWGKAFFRTGVPGLTPMVHHAKIGGVEKKDEPFHPAMKLLHFHASDPEEWRASARRRAETGAYRFRTALRDLILSLDDQGLRAFHAFIHRPDAARLKALRDAGLLVEVDLHLRDKVAALRRA